jgi:hypothetical protein
MGFVSRNLSKAAMAFTFSIRKILYTNNRFHSHFLKNTYVYVIFKLMKQAREIEIND